MQHLQKNLQKLNIMNAATFFVWVLTLHVHLTTAVDEDPDWSLGEYVTVGKNHVIPKKVEFENKVEILHLPAAGPGTIVRPPGYERWYPNKEKPGRRIIPCVLDPAYSSEEKEVINGALLEISKRTCVDFKMFSSETLLLGKDFLYFSRGSIGCSSKIGRQGGKQIITLPEGCIWHWTALHEVMHAIGFNHQHVTPSRDKFVTVLMENVTPEAMKFNFVVSPYDTSYGSPYDYRSVLHYGKAAFAKSGTLTIIPKKEKVQIGERTRLSFWDVYKIRRLFQC